uniref:Protein mono-ADP-ribosyltransferase PARP14-like n=1 Tax=Mastacembelus armatus TaxID=205130 RepID=A0A7N9AQL9_9TELE
MSVRTTRIVVLGKTGAGKSSLGNTVFGESAFQANHSGKSGTIKCQAKQKPVREREIMWIDTPGFFDTDKKEEEMKPEILRCITECAPGPHAFLIVLKVEKFTEQEQAVITKICQYFSEDALKYAVVVFTHGDQLPKRINIEEFVSRNEKLSDLVKKCGGRCLVTDNKYWKNKEYNYMSNQVQVSELLKTVDKIINANNENYYTNEMLQAVKREIQMEEETIRQSSPNMSREKIRNKATKSVFERLLIRFTGVTTGLVLGALLGVAGMFSSVFNKSPVQIQSSSDFAALALTHGIKERVLFAAERGGVKGSKIGYSAAEVAENPMDAVQLTADAVWNQFE